MTGHAGCVGDAAEGDGLAAGVEVSQRFDGTAAGSVGALVSGGEGGGHGVSPMASRASMS